LANTRSAKKRIRQTEKRTAQNRHFRGSARTYIRKVRKLLADGDLDAAQEAARQAFATLDKAGRRHVIHPRNAARRKGRLMAAIAAAQSENAS
jgi:small subunit ribosomal protein S20